MSAPREVRTGAGAPYRVRPVMFKGMQYTVRDREDGSVYITRSLLGAQRRAAKLNEAAEAAEAKRTAQLWAQDAKP